MSQDSPKHAVIPRHIANEAIDLWMLLQEVGESGERRQLLERLAQWQNRSVLHKLAWQRLTSFQTDWDALHTENLQGVSRRVLGRRKALGRRQLLLAGIACGALSTGWFWSQRQPFAGVVYRTGVGEVRSLTLHNGSRVQLNTSTELYVSVGAEGEMHLRLTAGEILVETVPRKTSTATPDPAMVVQTELMRVQPLGTRFSVRVDDAYVKASLYEGGLQLDSPLAEESWQLLPGESLTLSRSGKVSRGQSNSQELAWQRRMLVVNRMPLQHFLKELSRYHHMWVRCAPSIAEYPVSGTYPIDDLSSVFKVLGDQLGVEFNTYLGVWVIARDKLS